MRKRCEDRRANSALVDRAKRIEIPVVVIPERAMGMTTTLYWHSFAGQPHVWSRIRHCGVGWENCNGGESVPEWRGYCGKQRNAMPRAYSLPLGDERV